MAKHILAAVPIKCDPPADGKMVPPTPVKLGNDSGKDTFVFSGSFGQNTITNFITKDGGNHDTLELSKAEFGDLATKARLDVSVRFWIKGSR
jgi:hypothetical protein